MKVLFKLFGYLIRPIYRIKDYPVMYRGKNITLLNYGIFQAASGMSFSAISFYYLYLTGYEITFKMLSVSILFPMLMWSGAKLFYYFVWLEDLLENPRETLFQTGFSIHGAIIGAIIGAYIVSKFCSIPVLTVLDAVSFGALAGVFWGRLGCYNYGCCYGTPTAVPWAITYKNRDSKILRTRHYLASAKIHPVQLYAALLSISAFIATIYLLPLGLPKGAFISFFLLFHSLKRICLEKFRYDLSVGDEKNNKTLYTALLFVFVGLLLFVFVVDHEQDNATSFVMEVSWETFLNLFLNHPGVLIFTLIAGFLAFIGYGVHGKTLGTFPFIN